MGIKIIAIDDQAFYLDEIARKLKKDDVSVIGFEGPNFFEEEASSEEIEASDIILMDYDFGSSTAVDRDLPRWIRSNFRFNGHMILLSLLDNFDSDEKYISANFDGVISKERLCWENIEKIVNKNHTHGKSVDAVLPC